MAPGAPEGLCPRCLVGLNFDTATHLPGETAVGAAARSAKSPLSLAEVAALFPHLDILRLVGQGGMGAVYQARQPTLDRFVALKILTTPSGEDHGFTERFTREARALAKLNHPNIVAVHDFGTAGGHFFLLMEFADGLNLRELLRAGKIVPAEALAIVPKICDALQYAHEHGIVHRDIKPENILLDQRGHVKIADFGIAKILGAGPAMALTGAHDRMGTPHYMAPEQVEHPLAVDHRADIYSLGVVFYEMLTGELPLGRFAPPSRKVQVDVRLDEIVLRALEKEPERRYQQASEVKTQVDTVVAGAAATGPATVLPLWRRPAVRRVAMGAVAIFLVVVALVFLGTPAGRRALFARENNVLVVGEVTDLAGRPLRNARVADNIYGGGSDQAPRETWTKANGRFELTTQREEHTIAASAPGYETALGLLRTGWFDSAPGVELNFKLKPIRDPVALIAGFAPVVVETWPVAGAEDVEPGIVEVRATFSKRMTDRSWTWAWGGGVGEAEPEIVEAPRYDEARRTCMVKLKLAPNRTYALWLNTGTTHHFKDEDGNPAVPYLLAFRTSSGTRAPAANRPDAPTSNHTPNTGAPRTENQMAGQTADESAAALRGQHWQEDLDQLAEELPQRFKDFQRLILPEVFQREIAQLKSEAVRLTDAEIEFRLLRLISQAGVAHSGVRRPSSNTERFPLQLYWFSDGLAVTAASAAWQDTVGTRVVQIGNSTPEELERALAAYIPHENAGWLRHRAQTEMTRAALLRHLGIADSDGRIEWRFAKRDGTTFARTFGGEDPPQKASPYVNARGRSGATLPLSARHPKEPYWFEYVPETQTLFVQYNQCVDLPTAPFAEFAERVFATTDAQPVRRFIIDLRQNSGGNSTVIEPLLNGLGARPALTAKGHLYVLIGRRTFSSGQLAVVTLQSEFDAILVGEPTGGKPNHYGELGTFTLPHSRLEISYPKKYFKKRSDADPASVKPDISVSVPLEAFLTGTDPVLEAALRHIPSAT